MAEESDRPLTPEERAQVRAMIEAFRGARATASMIKIGLIGLGMIAAALSAWDTVAAKARSWLSH